MKPKTPLVVELTPEQFLTLQRAQYRNGESIQHTLLRMAGLAPPVPQHATEIDPNLSFFDQISARAQEELTRQEDARVLALVEEWDVDRMQAELREQIRLEVDKKFLAHLQESLDEQAADLAETDQGELPEENELRVRATPAEDKGARINAYVSGALDEREDVIAWLRRMAANARHWGGSLDERAEIYDRLVDVFECGEHREEQENEHRD